MQTATITTLARQIEHEERIVGIRPDVRVTRAVIARRQVQVAFVCLGVAIALVGVAFSPRGTFLLKVLTVLLAVAMTWYAVEQDRHLRRLARLTHESRAIDLAVVDALTSSGALAVDRAVLRVRKHLEHVGLIVAVGLVDVLAAASVRFRIVGPSGEVPVAAASEGASSTPEHADAARRAARTARPSLFPSSDGGSVLVVPVTGHGEVIAVVEVVSPAGVPYRADDWMLVDAYSRGAIAALRTL